MNYGEVRRMALRLIFSDTSAGQIIPEGYNDQADYLAAIPAFVDSALHDIAVRTGRLTAAVPLASLTIHAETGRSRVYELPEDCIQVTGVLLPELQSASYHILGGRLYVNRELPDGSILSYRRFPVSVGSEPADSLELDGTPEIHSAIAYYVAAQLVLYDDSYRYAVLRNEYESRVTALRQIKAELYDIADQYGGFGAVTE